MNVINVVKPFAHDSTLQQHKRTHTFISVVKDDITVIFKELKNTYWSKNPTNVCVKTFAHCGGLKM